MCLKKDVRFVKELPIYNKINTSFLFNIFTQKKTHSQFKRDLYMILDRFFWACLKKEYAA